MFGPGLRQRLQLDIGRGAADLFVKVLDRAHLGQIKREQACFAQRQEVRISQPSQRDGFDLGIWRSFMTKVGQDRAETIVLDRLVTEQATGQPLQVRRCEIAIEAVAGCGRHFTGGQADFDHPACQFTRPNIGDSWSEGNFDQRGRASGLGRLISEGLPGGLFSHRVSQQQRTERFKLHRARIRRQKVKACDLTISEVVNPKCRGIVKQAGGGCMLLILYYNANRHGRIINFWVGKEGVRCWWDGRAVGQ